MRIAVTADIHLRKKNDTPERYAALEEILKYSLNKNIKTLIIAGDLFDKKVGDYSDFDNLVNSYTDNINIYVIPGNHDSGFYSNKVNTIRELSVVNDIDKNTPFVFIPYTEGGMGSGLKETSFDKQPVIIGHGDFISSAVNSSDYEDDSPYYMPLTKSDINSLNPKKVFLGHIHKKSSPNDNIFYPGSPVSLAKDETGIREFIVYDTDSDTVDYKKIRSGLLRIRESIIVFPGTEESDINTALDKILKSNDINPKDFNKVTAEISLKGITPDKEKLPSLLSKIAAEKEILISPDSVDISEVEENENPALQNLIENLRAKIDKEYAEKKHIAHLIPDMEDAALKAVFRLKVFENETN